MLLENKTIAPNKQLKPTAVAGRNVCRGTWLYFMKERSNKITQTINRGIGNVNLLAAV